MSLSLALHLLAATIWVGGMFFVYQILRPVRGKCWNHLSGNFKHCPVRAHHF